MAAPTLTVMRGYPGSGKTTRARQIAKETGAVVICRDHLRKMLHDTIHHTRQQALENEVSIAEHAQVQAFLQLGKSVIVDATHLDPAQVRKWALMAAHFGAKFERVDVKTPVADCILRDYQRGAEGGRSVGKDVILRMAAYRPMEDWPDIQALPAYTPTPAEGL